MGLNPSADLTVGPCFVLGFGVAQLDVKVPEGSHSCPVCRTSSTKNVPVRCSRLSCTRPVAVSGSSRRTTQAGCLF